MAKSSYEIRHQVNRYAFALSEMASDLIDRPGDEELRAAILGAAIVLREALHADSAWMKRVA